MIVIFEILGAQYPFPLQFCPWIYFRPGKKCGSTAANSNLFRGGVNGYSG